MPASRNSKSLHRDNSPQNRFERLEDRVPVTQNLAELAIFALAEESAIEDLIAPAEHASDGVIPAQLAPTRLSDVEAFVLHNIVAKSAGVQHVPSTSSACTSRQIYSTSDGQALQSSDSVQWLALPTLWNDGDTFLQPNSANTSHDAAINMSRDGGSAGGQMFALDGSSLSGASAGQQASSNGMLLASAEPSSKDSDSSIASFSTSDAQVLKGGTEPNDASETLQPMPVVSGNSNYQGPGYKNQDYHGPSFTPPGLNGGWPDPLWVLDANDGIVLTPGVIEDEYSTWAVDLRAQVSGGTVQTYSWDLSNAPAATNITGQSTHRLQFTWASFMNGVSENTIVCTTTNTDSTVQTQTLTFRVTGMDISYYVPPRPTSVATWATVITPDRISADQDLISGQNYSMSLASGGLYTAHAIPSYGPGSPQLGLTYSSLAADPRPIFLDHFELDPAQTTAPSHVSAKLTLNGVAGSQIWYDTSLLNPGDIMQIALQADATGLTTGRYSYSIEIKSHYGTTVTTTHSGNVVIINGDDSLFGDGWSLAGLHRIHSVTGGVILSVSSGLSHWYADGQSSGTFTSPAGDFATLVRNANNTYTRTLKDGTKINFDANGRQTSVVDLNSNTTQYSWDTNGRLTSIVDANSITTALSYNAAGRVSTITDPASRVTAVTYDGSHRLTRITDPDTAEWDYAYDSSDRLTSLTDVRNNATAFTYNFAGRISTVTRPDTTTEGLTSMQMRGLAQSPYGTQGNPQIAMLAVEAQATYTDPRTNQWKSRLDWLGFGAATQFVTPLGHTSVVHVNASGSDYMTTDPISRRTFMQYDTKGNITKRTLPDNFFESFTYNTFSQPTKYTDPRGYSTDYTYSTTGNLTKIKNALLHETTFTYTTDGLLASTTDPLLKTTSFTYDTRDRLTRTTHPDDDADPNNNPFVTFAYDTAGNRTQSTDERNFSTLYEYDAVGRPTEITLPDDDSNSGNNPVYTTAYDANGNVTSVTDPLLHVRSSTYDTLNRLLTQTDPDPDGAGSLLASVTTMGYDAAGNVTSVTDPMSRPTSFGYDASGRQTSMTLPDPDGAGLLTAPAYAYAYDAASQKTSETDPLNRTTTFAYTARGWLSTVEGPLGNESGFGYDQNGNRTARALIPPGGSTNDSTGYMFDPLNRMTRHTDPMQNSIEYAYDANDRLTSTGRGSGFNTSFAYNARGWQTSITEPDPDGAGTLTSSVTSVGYDAAGNQTSVTDPMSRTTTNVFDAQGRLKETIDPRTGSTQYTFDLADRFVALTDAVNNTTTWAYDNADRLISEISPLTSSRNYQYNSAGEITLHTDRNGRRTRSNYDNIGRLTSDEWLDAVGVTTRTISYAYNSGSELTSAADPDSAYAHTYDLAGRLSTVNNSGTPGVPSVTLTYGYDFKDNRTSRTDNLASSGSTTWNYDKADRLTSVALSASGGAANAWWTYDTKNRVTALNRNSTMYGMWTDFTYDNASRVTQIKHSAYPVGTRSQFDYDYNAAHEVTSYTGPEGTLSYSYDTTGQLTGASGARTETYSYDLNGNRNPTGYVTTAGNRLQSDGTFNYTYDNEGNLLTRTRVSDSQLTEFIWDYRNRLTKVLVKNSSGTVLKEARFTYDVYDRRIGRWYDQDGAGAGAAVQEWTVFDGDNAYADFDSSGALQRRYLFGQGVDKIMARVSASGIVEWYLTDRLGSVRQITNQGGSTILDAITYDSYGRILSETAPNVGGRYKFTGREWESVFDQYYYRGRFYDPFTGRFTGVDPIGFEADDANLYRYVGNTPLNSTDPFGLQENPNVPLDDYWASYYNEVSAAGLVTAEEAKELAETNAAAQYLWTQEAMRAHFELEQAAGDQRERNWYNAAVQSAIQLNNVREARRITNEMGRKLQEYHERAIRAYNDQKAHPPITQITGSHSHNTYVVKYDDGTITRVLYNRKMGEYLKQQVILSKEAAERFEREMREYKRTMDVPRMQREPDPKKPPQ